MKLTQLRNLRAVADAGSVRQASRDLNLSQSAITKSIQMLEAELDTKLLHRASHGVSTTASGEALVARACIIESELKNARDDIARIEGAFTGDVRVCVSPTTAINMVPKALINLKRRRPAINVKIEENVYPDNLAPLRRGDVDVAVCMLPEKFKDDDLVSEVLIEDEVTPAVSVGHPLTRKRDLAFEDLIDEDWVLFGQSISDHAIHEQTFRVNGFEPPVSTVVCASFTCALALVENGNYVMLVPKQVFRGRVKGFPITPLRLTTPMQPWTIAVISRPSNLLAPACQEFVDELRKVVPLISIRS